MDTDITREEFDRLESKLDALNSKIDYIVERQRWQADLVDEFGPIGREAMKVAADRLHGMDQAGYFAFGREALRVVERIVDSYSEDDVRLLGDHIVGIMDTVKNITQPAILAVANEATDVLYNADDVEPMGVVGMVKASQDDEVQKGMAIMFEVLRQIGRTVSDTADGSERAPRRIADRKAARSSRKNGSNGAGEAKAATAPLATSEADNGGGVNGGGQGGWQLTEDGHLADPEEWSRDFAFAMAGSLGLPHLTGAHWQVLEFARNEWLETKAAPNIRRITSGSGVSTKELYQLFPKAPARTVARIAGIPKPVGCI